jgi:hypothetical protein
VSWLPDTVQRNSHLGQQLHYQRSVAVEVSEDLIQFRSFIRRGKVGTSSQGKVSLAGLDVVECEFQGVA